MRRLFNPANWPDVVHEVIIPSLGWGLGIGLGCGMLVMSCAPNSHARPDPADRVASAKKAVTRNAEAESKLVWLVTVFDGGQVIRQIYLKSEPYKHITPSGRVLEFIDEDGLQVKVAGGTVIMRQVEDTRKPR